ncbi:MAG: hypothetical protein ACLR0P_11140 [Oscillospiraceae bacterium]
MQLHRQAHGFVGLPVAIYVLMGGVVRIFTNYHVVVITSALGSMGPP